MEKRNTMKIEYLPQGGRGRQWRIIEGLTDARVSRVDAAGALRARGLSHAGADETLALAKLHALGVPA